MTCQQRGDLIICSPNGYAARRILPCPTCEQRRRMVVLSYVWYGPTVTCCGCGERWNDGERESRPFRRGWRPERIAEARHLYARAVSRAEANAALLAELDEYRETP